MAERTIAAISTPSGEGGIGIVRISGEQSAEIADRVFKNINGKSTDKVLIDKIPSSYYEAAIGKNQNYYMPRFLILEVKSPSWE